MLLLSVLCDGFHLGLQACSLYLEDARATRLIEFMRKVMRKVTARVLWPFVKTVNGLVSLHHLLALFSLQGQLWWNHFDWRARDLAMGVAMVTHDLGRRLGLTRGELVGRSGYFACRKGSWRRRRWWCEPAVGLCCRATPITATPG